MIDVEQLRNGNEDTLTRLMEKYHRPLIYFSFQYVKILEVAEDIVSETFINFWELRDNFQNESKIKSFLYISTKNTCLNHLKSHQSKRRLPLEEIHESQLISDVDINSRIIKSELLEVIYTAIKKLPEKQQNVLKLTFDKDMSTEQICSELGISNRGMDDFEHNQSQKLVTIKFDMNKILVNNKTKLNILPLIKN